MPSWPARCPGCGRFCWPARRSTVDAPSAETSADGAVLAQLAAIVAEVFAVECVRPAVAGRSGRRGVRERIRWAAAAFAAVRVQRWPLPSGWGPASTVEVVGGVILLASVLLAVLRSLLTYGNLVLLRQADVLHLRHGLLRLRERAYDMSRLRGGTCGKPLLVRVVRWRPAWTR